MAKHVLVHSIKRHGKHVLPGTVLTDLKADELRALRATKSVEAFVEDDEAEPVGPIGGDQTGGTGNKDVGQGQQAGNGKAPAKTA